MKIAHSESLVLVWRVAELEARKLRASVIEPAHLLLGLCKSVDLDLPAIVRQDSPKRDEVLEEWLREVRRLREIFRAVGLDARAFRRAFRRENARVPGTKTGKLRRSESSKRVFAEAEHFAGIANSIVFPVQLLYAVLSIEDQTRDDVLKQVGVAVQTLRNASKHKILSRQALGSSVSGCN